MELPTVFELQQTVGAVAEHASYATPIIWHAGTQVCVATDIEPLIIEVWRAALNKVAQDWADTFGRNGSQVHADVGIIEVQAFLDSRHVHYPECWSPTHPQYKKKV